MIISLTDVQLKRATDHKRGNIQHFLDRLLVEVISENYRYFLAQHLATELPLEEKPETYCWPPLLSSERQVSGLFATGLSRISPISRPEHPVSRVRKAAADEESEAQSSTGRIDFLAYYGNRDVALELKRYPISTVGDSRTNKGLKNQWDVVSNQSKQALLHMRKQPRDYTSPVSVGLMVIRVGRKVTSKVEIDEARTKAVNALPSVANGIRILTKADYLSYYSAPSEMQVSYGWGENEDQYAVFPGVVFAAVVHESVKGA